MVLDRAHRAAIVAPTASHKSNHTRGTRQERQRHNKESWSPHALHNTPCQTTQLESLFSLSSACVPGHARAWSSCAPEVGLRVRRKNRYRLICGLSEEKPLQSIGKKSVCLPFFSYGSQTNNEPHSRTSAISWFKTTFSSHLGVCSIASAEQPLARPFAQSAAPLAEEPPCLHGNAIPYFRTHNTCGRARLMKVPQNETTVKDTSRLIPQNKNARMPCYPLSI